MGLHGTLFTLFNIMTLCAWGYITRICMKDYTWAWVPFILYVMVSSFFIFSLIIAVVCDAVSELHSTTKEDELTAKVKVESEKKEKLKARMKELTFQISSLLKATK